jgi:hypothetical protein
MKKQIHKIIEALKTKDVQFDDGLTDSEVSGIENKFEIKFPSDLKIFLQNALPISDGFVNWRLGLTSKKEFDTIKNRLNCPWEGMLFDIKHNFFWLESWGIKPRSRDERIRTARKHYKTYPKLIPIYSHRYIPESPHDSGNPIFSVHQMDIIYYGSNLEDYFVYEFKLKSFKKTQKQTYKKIEFWTSTVEDDETYNQVFGGKNLIKNIVACKRFLNNNNQHYTLFKEEEYLILFAESIERYMTQGVPSDYGLPFFKDEVTPAPKEVMASFQSVLETSNASPEAWAKAIEATPFEYLLILIGQRWTSASMKDERAIPPLQQTLLDSCFTPYNDQISVVTRAWEKHMGRSTDTFWGIATGNPSQKEQAIREVVTHMIDTKTWWNVFYHYKHELVYEIRVSTGHGIRWNKEGTQLIGFLEPFL